jgi:hypothetical protein
LLPLFYLILEYLSHFYPTLNMTPLGVHGSPIRKEFAQRG